MLESRKVFITCKTYPQPSISHRETVCTAGVSDKGELIRLYPINFRYLPQAKQFNKYDWVEAPLKKRIEDPRPESYSPQLNDLVVHTAPEGRIDWEDRRQIVFKAPLTTSCDLLKKRQQEVSLGLVKPRKVVDFSVKADDQNWKPEHQALLQQVDLFFGPPKRLAKVPYKFYYNYFCENSECNGHQQSIIDWEVYSLFLKMRAKYNNDAIAIEKVKYKFMNLFFDGTREIYFFLGTVLEHSAWLIIGIFYPPMRSQRNLFTL